MYLKKKQKKYFSNIKKNYGCKEIEDYYRLIDRVELMLKETDKHKGRLSNKKKRVIRSGMRNMKEEK